MRFWDNSHQKWKIAGKKKKTETNQKKRLKKKTQFNRRGGKDCWERKKNDYDLRGGATRK